MELYLLVGVELFVCPYLTLKDKMVLGFLTHAVNNGFSPSYPISDQAIKNTAEAFSLKKQAVHKVISKAEELGFLKDKFNAGKYITLPFLYVMVGGVFNTLYGKHNDYDEEIDYEQYKEAYQEFTSIVFKSEGIPPYAELVENAIKNLPMFKEFWHELLYEQALEDLQMEIEHA